MSGRLLELHVENFRSLRDVTIPLGPLTVLVGPNGVGKSNVLKVFDFLAAIIRTDLQPALDERGGFDEVAFWGGEKPPTSLAIRLTADWTTHASAKAPDEYSLTIRRRSLPGRSDSYTLSRQESFQFKRTQGRGRRIKISGDEARVVNERAGRESDGGKFGIQRLSSGLSTLPRLGRSDGGEEVARVAERLSSFRVFDVDVTAARQPTRTHSIKAGRLEPHAKNLAAFLIQLSTDEERWDHLTHDARRILPQLDAIEFEQVGGFADRLAVVLRERGLRRPTPLADASFGTVRLLGLLAMLYDPQPPALTCVEEIDHGLHPQALELIVERMREASARTQFIVATHSPALVDRLEPHEFIVCDRDEDGASIIPALTTAEIQTTNSLVSKARGKARLKAGEFVGIAVHEDMDACPGPAYDAARRSVSAALGKAAGDSSSVYALAAAESEAWLLLFPEAFTLHRASWKIPATWKGKDSGRRQNPKEDLEGLLTAPRFRESDGPEIVSAALAKGLLTEPKGSNRSYQEFIADIRDWKVPRPPGR